MLSSTVFYFCLCNSGLEEDLVVLVEILAQINKPFNVMSALQSVWFIYSGIGYEEHT